MRAIAEAPTGNSTAWTVSMQRDDPVIDPIILAPPSGSDEETLALNRATLKLRIDPVKRRIDLDQADVRRIATRATHNFGVAFSGSLDMSSDKQRLAFGVAGNRLPTWALKRLWPAFIAPNVRRWAADHVSRGTVDVAPGRRLNIAGGVFQAPDTHPKPSPTHVSFRIDGTLPAAATLLQSDGLRDKVGLPLDPASTRGAVSAQVNLDFPLGKDVPADAFTYGITADITNFGADKGLLGQKVEAASLKASASSDGYQIAGDARIN